MIIICLPEEERKNGSIFGQYVTGDMEKAVIESLYDYQLRTGIFKGYPVSRGNWRPAIGLELEVWYNGYGSIHKLLKL